MAANSTANNTSTTTDDATVDVILLASVWNRMSFDAKDNPVFKLYFQGQELEITQDEYDLLQTNPIRPMFQLVDNSSSTNSSTSSTSSSSTTSTSTTASS